MQLAAPQADILAQAHIRERMDFACRTRIAPRTWGLYAALQTEKTGRAVARMRRAYAERPAWFGWDRSPRTARQDCKRCCLDRNAQARTPYSIALSHLRWQYQWNHAEEAGLGPVPHWRDVVQDMEPAVRVDHAAAYRDRDLAHALVQSARQSYRGRGRVLESAFGAAKRIGFRRTSELQAGQLRMDRRHRVVRWNERTRVRRRKDLAMVGSSSLLGDLFGCGGSVRRRAGCDSRSRTEQISKRVDAQLPARHPKIRPRRPLVLRRRSCWRRCPCCEGNSETQRSFDEERGTQVDEEAQGPCRWIWRRESAQSTLAISRARMSRKPRKALSV